MGRGWGRRAHAELAGKNTKCFPTAELWGGRKAGEQHARHHAWARTQQTVPVQSPATKIIGRRVEKKARKGRKKSAWEEAQKDTERRGRATERLNRPCPPCLLLTSFLPKPISCCKFKVPQGVFCLQQRRGAGKMQCPGRDSSQWEGERQMCCPSLMSTRMEMEGHEVGESSGKMREGAGHQRRMAAACVAVCAARATPCALCSARSAVVTHAKSMPTQRKPTIAHASACHAMPC